MKRNKKNIIITTLALVVIGLITWGCIYLFAPKAYDEMIPAEAKIVIRLQPSESNAAELKKIVDAIGMTTEGVDLSNPIYAFVTPNEYIGITAKISDEKLIRNAIDKLLQQKKAQSIEESDGMQWTWIQTGWLIAWTHRALLVVGPGLAAERDLLRQTASTLVNSGNCFKDTPAFDHLKTKGGFMQIYATMDALPAPYNMIFRLNIPATCDPAAVQLYASAEKQTKCKTLISSTINSDNESILEEIKSSESIKSRLTITRPELTDSALFYMATSLQGKDLLSMLKTDATLRGLLLGVNQTIDADKILGSTNGLFSIELGEFDKDWTPSFCLKGQTASKNLFSDAPYWMKSAKKQHGVTLNQLTPTDYFLKGNKEQVRFGLTPHDNTPCYYFASPSMESTISTPMYVSRTSANTGEFTYVSINLTRLFQQPSMREGTIATLLKTLIPGTRRLTYKALPGLKGQMIIE